MQSVSLSMQSVSFIKHELKCLEMYINIRMAWCGNLGVYMKVQLDLR